MENVFWMIFEALLYVYIGIGVGLQIRRVRDGRTLHYRNREGKYTKCSKRHLAIYMPVMSIVWPIYYTKFYRKIYKMPGVW